MRSMAFIVNAILGSLGNYAKLTLITALESHVATEEGVWMELQTPPVSVTLATLELHVISIQVRTTTSVLTVTLNFKIIILLLVVPSLQ